MHDDQEHETQDHQPTEKTSMDDELEITGEAHSTKPGDSPDEFVAQQPPLTRDEELEQMRAAVQEADKRVLMAQAEAENFRKRMRRDLEEQMKFASLALVTDLLEVRDNLSRALEASASGHDAGPLRDGVAMVLKQLDDTLAKHGVREIPAEGELFDPNFHEAISQMPSQEYAAGMVAHVAVSGFQMHDRVVRPSQVVVSSGSGDPSTPN